MSALDYELIRQRAYDAAFSETAVTTQATGPAWPSTALHRLAVWFSGVRGWSAARLRPRPSGP